MQITGEREREAHQVSENLTIHEGWKVEGGSLMRDLFPSVLPPLLVLVFPLKLLADHNPQSTKSDKSENLPTQAPNPVRIVRARNRQKKLKSLWFPTEALDHIGRV
jgi:hypothetical protein